jgi:hypothetical protein
VPSYITAQIERRCAGRGQVAAPDKSSDFVPRRVGVQRTSLVPVADNIGLDAAAHVVGIRFVVVPKIVYDTARFIS